jgi:hypothetical protein
VLGVTPGYEMPMLGTSRVSLRLLLARVRHHGGVADDRLYTADLGGAGRRAALDQESSRNALGVVRCLSAVVEGQPDA